MDHPSTDEKNKSKEPPAPEVLKAQFDDVKPTKSEEIKLDSHKMNLRAKHGVYRPTHKATFFGLSAVVIILIVNAVIIYFVMNTQSSTTSTKNQQSDVSISPTVLNSLGVSRNTIGSSGAELIVKPNSTFSGKVTISGETSLVGQLKLNSKLVGTDASFGKLEAGDTSVSKINVNGDATVTNLNLRKDLTVIGSTRLQGAVTISQLLTVANNMNISGNLAVGGVLSARSFQANNLTSDTILTIGGHIITGGSSPSSSKGWGLGDLDTVSNSGNDASGTVAVNIGSIARSGIVANVYFAKQYSNTPHIVVTAVGPGASDVYINRTSTGFSIGVSSIATGGHTFDYIVMQ